MTSRRLAVTVDIILWITITVSNQASCCSDVCWFAYHNTTGGTKSENLIQVPSNRKVTGIITLDAEYLANPSAWEYLRFMRDEDSQTLVVQIYAGEPGVLGKIRLFPEDNTGPLYNVMFSQEQVFTEQNINIQISDENILKDRAYQLYLGTPGDALSLKYGYQYSAYWDRFFDSRLNDTTIIKSDNKATVVKAVTICEHAQPQLCDAHKTEVIATNLGESYNLSCSGSGAPYLEATWYRGLNSNITEEIIIETYDNRSSADNFVSSTLMITSFSASHIGKWTCKITNKNFGLSVEKTYIMTTVKIPETHYNKTEDNSLTFAVQGWEGWIAHRENVDHPKIILNCGVPNNADINYIRTSLEQEARLFIRKGSRSDQLECTLYYIHNAVENNEIYSVYDNPHQGQYAVLRSADPKNNEPEEKQNDGQGPTYLKLKTVTITPVGYNCIEGEFGVKDLCKSCPKGETSSSGSTECYQTSNKLFIIGAVSVVVCFCAGIIGIAVVLKMKRGSGWWVWGWWPLRGDSRTSKSPPRPARNTAQPLIDSVV